MKLFISWSGNFSLQVARALRDGLPLVFKKSIKPFVSEDDIEKGVRWSQALEQKLSGTDLGIVCLTPSNVNAPWLDFEAGALSNAICCDRVMPFLFGVDRGQLTGPLAQFQLTFYGEDEEERKQQMKKLVFSINDSMRVGRVGLKSLERAFEENWTKLDAELSKLFADRYDLDENVNWLLRPGDLARIGAKSTINEIWVVTPCPLHDLERTCVREMIRRNIVRGVKYVFLMPNSGDNNAVAENLRQIFSGRTSQLIVRMIDAEKFDSLAVTHYLILNPGHLDQGPPEVLLELPIEDGDHWIKVSDEAAIRFMNRFQAMIDHPYDDCFRSTSKLFLSFEEIGSLDPLATR